MDSRELVQALQATTVLLSDKPYEAKRTDTVFFHARAWEDDDGLFPLASRLYHLYKTNSVSINGGEGGPPESTIGGQNWPGCGRYYSRLKELKTGVIYITDPANNTKEENEMFLMLAMRKEWRSAIIIGQPHQILREFLGMIASMRDHKYWMRIYAVAPKTVDWTKLIYGSPGVPFTPRFDHITQELERIPRYQAKGDLAQYYELYPYLRVRSSITRTWSPTEHPVR